MTQTPWVPQSNLQLGRYQFLEPLGRTGSARAYRAKSIGIEGFEKQVVIWRIGEATLEEARQTALLSHANIAQVLDVGRDDGGCFVVTEYVSGVSLASVLAEPVSWPVMVHIAIQVANALDYAHARRDANQNLLGIVHRSVSAHRILVSTAGGVKLTGFGTTSARRRDLTDYEARHRSPEELAQEPVDGRSDSYSLALVLREGLPPDRPIGIDHAISRALATYPETRSTAGELRDDLTRILHERREWVSPHQLAKLATNSVSVGAGARASASASARVSVSASASPAVSDLVSAASSLEASGALYAAIDYLETAIELSEPPVSFEGADATLALYERLGGLCLRAYVGDRGARAMVAGLDLADGVGRDDCAVRLCELLAELLGQADRIDESRDWRERARRALAG